MIMTAIAIISKFGWWVNDCKPSAPSCSLWRKRRIRRRACWNFVLSVSPLQHEADTPGTTKWKATPKLHLLRHLGVEKSQSWGNPRFTWTYADEDVVGAMIAVSRSLFKHLVQSFCDDLLVMTRADSICRKKKTRV